MLEMALVLRLHPAQVAQLIGYCTEYRSSLWQSVLPTPERNQTLRRIQALQGRLEKAQEQAQAGVALPVKVEEKETLRQMLSGLIRLHSDGLSSEQCKQELGEVTACLIAIQRMLCQTQP